MIIILWIGCFAYILFRLLLLLNYQRLNRRIWEKQSENHHMKSGCFLPPLMPIPESEDREYWKLLLNLDKTVKRIGSIILAFLSFALIVLQEKNNVRSDNLLHLAFFPIFLQIFNSIFEWFEIDDNVGLAPVLPKRFLARKRKSNLSYQKNHDKENSK